MINCEYGLCYFFGEGILIGRCATWAVQTFVRCHNVYTKLGCANDRRTCSVLAFHINLYDFSLAYTKPCSRFLTVFLAFLGYFGLLFSYASDILDVLEKLYIKKPYLGPFFFIAIVP